MERLKSILIILVLIAGFLGYSYFNYNKRRKAVDAVEEYRKTNNLVQIWHFREMHLNIFDKIIADKSQFNFIFVNASSVKKINNKHYWVQFSSWKNAQKLETLSHYTLDREDETFKITINDLFWVPEDRDTLNLDEIEGTVFEITDNWIKDYKNQ
ncbi:hypothetical protein [Sunxiuqinia rutila]|uniref:hypothetical protein n=1 Tax=Sunxiuqinia rutila TaxID=1397841 RepID=UPI003D3685A4